MRITPHGAAAILLKRQMMHKAQNRLEDDEQKDDDAEDGMRMADHARVRGHVDSQREGGDVEEVGDKLHEAVREPEFGEAEDADQDAAGGEDEAEGEGGHDGVRGDHAVVAREDLVADAVEAAAAAGEGVAAVVAVI